jgi:Protein of unknown function (DUF1488)
MSLRSTATHLIFTLDKSAAEANFGYRREVISVPLTRDKIVGHDRERVAFAFLMLNGNEPIECRISEAAMDALASERGSQTTDRQAQFLAHRDAIEKIASDLFDASPVVAGYVVRIFTKHVPKTRVVPNIIETASNLGHEGASRAD